MLGLKLKNSLFKFILSVITLILLANSSSGYAISQSSLNAIVNNRAWYDPSNDCSSQTGVVTSATSASGSISNTFIIGFQANTPKDTVKSVISKYHPAGLFLVGTTDAVAAGWNKSFIDELNQANGSPLIIASDEEGSSIHRYAHSPALPNAIDMGSMTQDQVADVGKRVGNKLAENGVTVDLAPVLDVSIDNTGKVAGTTGRAFSSDPNVVADKAGAFASGLNSAGIKPVYKHFPGIGTINGNSDLNVASTVDLNALKAKDLIPYQKIVNNNGAAVMMSNASTPGLTKPGEVASTSADAVNLLRSDYRFTGLIMTDDLKAVGVGLPLPQAVAKSLQAGIDAPLFTYTNDSDIDAAISTASALNINISDKINKLRSFKNIGNQDDQNVNTACCSTGGSSSLNTSPDINSSLAQAPTYWRDLITAAAPKYPDVDARLVAATLWIENRGWPDPNTKWATSSASAKGPWQFINSTWASMGKDGDGDGIADPNNPKDAVLAAFEHQRGSAGKPIALEYTGNPEEDFNKIIYKKSTDNLLYFIGKYNGSGAPNGVALKDFPRNQNSDYVIMGYWLLATNFQKTWNTTHWKQFIDVSKTSNDNASTSQASCNNSPGSLTPINKDRQGMIDAILTNSNIVFGNYQSADVQRRDIQNCSTDNLLGVILYAAEQSGVRVLINALASDHGGCFINSVSPFSSLHNKGKAIDIGYYGNGNVKHNADGDKLFKFLYNNREALHINQIIWQDPPAGFQCVGDSKPVDCYRFYGTSTMGEHYHHIHVGVE